MYFCLKRREEEGGLDLAWDERKKGVGRQVLQSWNQLSPLPTSTTELDINATGSAKESLNIQNLIFWSSAHQQRRRVVLGLDFYRASPFCPGPFILHSCSSDVAFMGGEGGEGNFGKTSFGQFRFVCLVIG